MGDNPMMTAPTETSEDRAKAVTREIFFIIGESLLGINHGDGDAVKKARAEVQAILLYEFTQRENAK